LYCQKESQVEVNKFMKGIPFAEGLFYFVDNAHLIS